MGTALRCAAGKLITAVGSGRSAIHAGTRTGLCIAVLFGLLTPCRLCAAPEGAKVTLGWNLPTKNMDGTPLTDLAGCKVYYGRASSNYTACIDLPGAAVTSCTVSGLVEGVAYYFNGTTYNTAGLESDFCREIARIATSRTNAFGVLPSHSCSGCESPGVSVVDCRLAFPSSRALLSLQWSPMLPAGWVLLSATGQGGAAVRGCDIAFSGPFTNNPLVFRYSVYVPGDGPATNHLTGSAVFRLDTMPAPASRAASPNPLPIVRHYAPLGHAARDFDGDGVCDLGEHLAGTDPMDAHSRLVLDVTIAEPSGPVRVQWASVTNRTYGLCRSTNLCLGFVPIATNIPATPPMNTYDDPAMANTPRAFYRVVIDSTPTTVD